MKKYLFVIAIAIISVLCTSCEKTVQLDTLAGTAWKYSFDSNNYQTYEFHPSGDCTYILHTEDDGDNSLPLQWSCTSSGYVKTTVKVTNRIWKTGSFNKDKGTLEMGGLNFELTKH